MPNKKLIVLPNKNIKAFYTLTKNVLTLYDSNQKVCDTWEIENSISKEFPNAYKDFIENTLSACVTVRELLYTFRTDFEIISDGEVTKLNEKYINIFVTSNGRAVYIKNNSLIEKDGI